VPSSDSANIFGLSERIRRAIESKPITTNSGEISVTVSLGLAVSSVNVPLDPEVMLNTADKALYRCKETGRNRSEMGVSQTATLSTASEILPVKTGTQ